MKHFEVIAFAPDINERPANRTLPVNRRAVNVTGRGEETLGDLGIARREIKPTTEMRKLSPALVEQLKERFARLNLVGVTFKAESRKMSVGIRQEDRDVLVSIGTGNVLGLLGADVNVTKLPAVMKVVHARTDTATMDETWLMMASV